MGRDFRRLTSDRNLPQSHQPRDQGTAGKGRSQHRTDPPKRRWAQANGEQGCPPAAGLGTVGRAGDTWRPRVTTALDVQESTQAGQGTESTGPLGVLSAGKSRYCTNWGTGGLANRKTHEGGDHPDRDAQFEHVNAQAEAFLGAGEPVV